MVIYAWATFIVWSLAFISLAVGLISFFAGVFQDSDAEINNIAIWSAMVCMILCIVGLIMIGVHPKSRHHAKYYKDHSSYVMPWIYPIIQNSVNNSESDDTTTSHSSTSDDEDDEDNSDDDTTADDDVDSVSPEIIMNNFTISWNKSIK